MTYVKVDKAEGQPHNGAQAGIDRTTLLQTEMLTQLEASVKKPHNVSHLDRRPHKLDIACPILRLETIHMLGCRKTDIRELSLSS